MPLDVAHPELDVMIGVLVAPEAFPVAIHEVIRHGEEGGRFFQSERSIGLWGVMSAGPGSRHQTDELLKQIRQFGFEVRLGSGFFGSHIELSVGGLRCNSSKFGEFGREDYRALRGRFWWMQ